MNGRVVLALALTFSVAMGALSSGGWWWVWLAGIALLLFGGRIRLPLAGIRLSPTDRFILRENRRTRRNTRRIARQRRRRIRDQRRAAQQRRRQPQ